MADAAITLNEPIATGQYQNQTGLSSGWVELLTSVLGQGATVGPAPYSQNWQSGRYYALPNYGSLTTNNSLGVGTLRATPFWVPNAITVSQLLFEVTTGGDATSVYRLGIYADDGTGHPGALVLDAGTKAVNLGGSGIPGVVTIAGLSTALNPGVYWIVGVIQGSITTQPTLRTIQGVGIMPNIDFGTTAPPTDGVVFGYNMSGVTGALPSTYTVNWLSSNIPRVYMKVT